MNEIATVDFETDPIGPRPDAYPPEPVGVAIKIGGNKAQYIAWGHPTNNGLVDARGYEAFAFTRETARRVLGEVFDSGRPLLFHNAKFDIAVAVEKLGLPMPTAARINDTLPQLFLKEPRASTYSLKPSAAAILGWAPEEQDAVLDWLIEHQPVPGKRLNDKPKGDNYAGAYIGLAPGDLVGRYAIGDVDRTYALHVKLQEDLSRPRKPVPESDPPEYRLPLGMLPAYRREMDLLPTIMEMERHGIRVDEGRLAHDVSRYGEVLQRLDAWVLQRLGRHFNLDSNDDLVQALIAAGLATTASLGTTKTGKVATNKKALARGVTDPQLMAVMRYRGALTTAVRTFMAPWLKTAAEGDGRVYTTWHTTRTDENGARTGRMSSTPNFQNCPKAVAPIFAHQQEGLPVCPLDLPPLPLVRQYVIPDEGHVLIDRDYASQELRILGHYEDGSLKRAYLENPWLDIHEHARQLVNGTLGTNYSRGPMKTVAFGLLYGQGIALLSRNLGIDEDEARKIKTAYLAMFPGLKELQDGLKQQAAGAQPIYTKGGREYYCEKSKLMEVTVPGRGFGALPSKQTREVDFAYRLLNLLIQGSAADCTKEAVIRYAAQKPASHKLLLLVHDEALVSVPADERDSGMECLRAAMESVEYDVPMLTEGKYSAENWASLVKYDEKGVRV